MIYIGYRKITTAASGGYCGNLVIFANLVTNCAGCFASRLAGCLAFTASTFFYSTLQVLSADCFNVCHDRFPSFKLNAGISFLL